MATNNASKDETGLSPKTALCLAAITMVAVDGAFHEEEIERLRAMVRADELAFLKAYNFYNERPLDVCIKVVSAKLSDQQKRIAYHVLFNLAQVDKDFAISEQDLLEQYAAEFGLNKDFVSSVKNQPKEDFDLSAFD